MINTLRRFVVLSNVVRSLVLCCSVSLVACSHFIKQTDSSASTADTNAVQDDTSYQDFDLSDDTLYDLMVAEIAAQRQQLNITLVNYLHQARATKDLGIIKRAVNAAQFMKDVEAIQEMGLLWAEVEPDSIPAHHLLALQYSLQQQFKEAVYHMDRVIELGGDARVDTLALGAQTLPEDKNQELLELYRELYAKHPDYYLIGHSMALLLREMKQYDKALELLRPILKEHPDFEPSIVLTTSILIVLGDLNAAQKYAEEQYERFPQNHALGRMYAGILVDQKELSEAERVFGELLVLYPKAPGLKLSYALVALENDKVAVAKRKLEELLEQNTHPNESHFYLGRIADREEDAETAIEHYYQVTSGIHFEPALERASYLLTQDDKTEEALEHLAKLREEKPEQAEMLWLLQYRLLTTINDTELAASTLDQAIDAHPDNENFLYARAMLFDQQGELDKMETDLRAIIEKNPKNAVALNALGYTLADKTDRTEEAFNLITLALSIKPENPAILDSMGWVLYRLDKKEEALVFLVKAYQVYPDPEVAAHFGEVLFMLEKTEQAKKVWLKALLSHPEHKVLTRTLERLAPDWYMEQKKAFNIGAKDLEKEPDDTDGSTEPTPAAE